MYILNEAYVFNLVEYPSISNLGYFKSGKLEIHTHRLSSSNFFLLFPNHSQIVIHKWFLMPQYVIGGVQELGGKTHLSIYFLSY